MLVKRTILLVLGLLLLASMASAADLSPSTITNSNTGSWLIAGEGGTSAITVHVRQASPLSNVSGANVAFSLSNPSLGTISPASVTTGSDGIANTVFTVNSLSGNGTIIANITYNDGATNPLNLMTFQLIDHDVPQYAFVDSPQSVPAGSVTQLNITFMDRNNNRIDNKNTAQVHTVLLTGLGSGGSGFWDGSEFASQISGSTDANGNVSVKVRVSTVAGDNNIWMDGIGNIPGQSIDIEGVSDSTPVSISQVTPSPPTWPADGTHAFNLYYNVQDKYGNPLDGANISLTSNTGESFFTTTSNGGIAYAQYGPKDATGTYTVTAKAVQNSSILCTSTGTVGYCSQNVVYYSLDPVDMILTASPQSLVSLDVTPTSQASIQARVVDVAGNPVQGQIVNFSEGAESFPGAPGGSYKETAVSQLVPGGSPVSVQTDSNGFATLQFIPGAFVTYNADPVNYNATATGARTVTASWTNGKTGQVITGTVTFTWKNYPYLTVTTLLDKTSAKVGDLLHVTITVVGNGAALQPKPIDVVISMDRSGSMLEGYPDNMVTAKSAASAFASCLTYGKDDIGIVSFGDNSATNGWVNLSPTLIQTWVAPTCTKYSYGGSCTQWSTGYWASSWNWDNVYGNWEWVANDALPECGTGCNGHSGSSYDPTATHQLYLNANYNNGNPMNYGTTGFGHTDLTFATHTLSDVNTALNGIVPGGGTPTREGLYDAVNLFPVASSGRVRAIILQTDGDWNTGGDPEGGSGATSLGNGVGTGSVITYANKSKVALYTIGLGVTSGSAIETELKRYAANDAGLYYSASDASKLAGIYTAIAGQLNQQAGGSTTLDMNMGTITVNGVSGVNSYNYLNYTAIPVGGRGTGLGKPTDSTYVDMYHTNTDDSITDYYNYTRDDTKNWTPAKRDLPFAIGTMHLDDTWQTSFAFNLTSNGTLVLFGPGSGSSLTFTDSSTGNTQTSQLDSKTVSVYQSVVNNAFGTKTLLVNQLGFVQGASPDPNIWTIQWNTTYTGASVAAETVQYLSSEPGSQWVTYPAAISDKPPSTVPLTDSLQIDTSSWKPGDTYTIQVTATAVNNDANPSSASIGQQKAVSAGKTFIKLE